MVNPMTVNAGLIVPLTGADVDTWGEDDVNPDFVAIDGLLCGVQGISLSNVPVTLTSPAGFAPTPGAGPVQSQNRVIRFTGALLANVTVTLPIPGSYLIDNRCTGNFVVTLRGITATEVVGLPPGEIVEIYNDGANVRFVGLGRLGVMEMWAGLSAMPAWVAACTVAPYLPCDGASVYNIADFPLLGARLGSTFGGNGLTTFGTPDARSRVPLGYGGGANRITTAIAGFDGDTLGAVGGIQGGNLAANQIPSLTSVNSSQAISVTSSVAFAASNGVPVTVSTPGSGAYGFDGGHPFSAQFVTATGNNSISVAYTNASQVVVNNVQPSIVTGIWVIKT